MMSGRIRSRNKICFSEICVSYSAQGTHCRMTGSYGLATGCLSFGGGRCTPRAFGSMPLAGGAWEGGDDEMGEDRIVRCRAVAAMWRSLGAEHPR